MVQSNGLSIYVHSIEIYSSIKFRSNITKSQIEFFFIENNGPIHYQQHHLKTTREKCITITEREHFIFDESSEQKTRSSSCIFFSRSLAHASTQLHRTSRKHNFWNGTEMRPTQMAYGTRDWFFFSGRCCMFGSRDSIQSFLGRLSFRYGLRCIWDIITHYAAYNWLWLYVKTCVDRVCVWMHFYSSVWVNNVLWWHFEEYQNDKCLAFINVMSGFCVWTGIRITDLCVSICLHRSFIQSLLKR